ADVPTAIDRKKTGGRMIEIVNRLLELLEYILLALAVAGHVGDGPHRALPGRGRIARRPEGAHPQPQPSHRVAVPGGDPHLLLQSPAVAARLEQTIDRLRNIRIADEYALDRPDVLYSARARKCPVGRIGVNNAPIGVSHHDAFL